MRALARHPLLHFLVLGALLFALDAQLETPRPVAPPPDDEALLVAEARARGLQHSDTLVRRRLVRNMRFLGEGDGLGDAELFVRALALGMDASDPVARRRLAQRIVLELRAAAREPEPDEAELAAYLERHPRRFAVPARVRLTQRFLGPAPLPLPARTAPLSRDELAHRLGESFADAVFALEPGRWHEPVASSYGLHRVRVDERRPARAARLEEVRGAVREALLAERAEAALERRLAWLRARR